MLLSVLAGINVSCAAYSCEVMVYAMYQLPWDGGVSGQQPVLARLDGTLVKTHLHLGAS